MRLKTIALKSEYNFPENMRWLCEQGRFSRYDFQPGLLLKLSALGYDGVRLPADDRFLKKEEASVEVLRREIDDVVGFTCLSYLKNRALRSRLVQSFSQLEVFIDEYDDESFKLACELSSEKFSFSLVVLKDTLKKRQYERFFRVLPNIHLYFPYPSVHKSGLKPRGISKYLDALAKNGIEEKARPPLYPLFDPRCVEDTREEYFWEPLVNSTKDSAAPRFSVIIPCFNNYPHLKKTLTNFILQSTAYSDYEIIVVDDGSEQTSFLEFQGWIKNFTGSGCQMKYIYSPRVSERSMGDGRYRAGVSRNLGVAHARGAILCFLDSDIIVPSDYLERVEQELEINEVIQCRRWDLSQKASEERTFYAEIKDEDLIYEDAYWDDFHRDTNQWNLLQDGWKYTCTHSLSLRTETFKEHGWILPCFIYYGFEDTELGYRLWKNGLKFHLSSMRVFHLYHKPERSEFLREKWKRDKILSKTAEIFFRHQPKRKIYDMFEGLLR